tara:strand:- start:244 stop:438 length:195 start_codon:yes stop_codon:yes gene_type:complete
MLATDYWAIKYLEDGKKTTFYVIANYKQYDDKKIRAIWNELKPKWEILKVYPIEKLNFRNPNGG